MSPTSLKNQKLPHVYFASPPTGTSALIELPSDALLDQRLVGPCASTQRRRLSKHIARVEHPGRPTRPSEEHITIAIERLQLLTDHGQAGAIRRPTTRLSQNSLPRVGPEIIAQRLERSHVVMSASSVRTAVVRVEVLMHVEDEVGGAAVEVGDFAESGSRAVLDVVRSGCVVGAGKEDLLGGGAGFADGCHGGLDGGCPFVDVEVVLYRGSVVDGAEEQHCGLTGLFMTPKATLESLEYLVAI